MPHAGAGIPDAPLEGFHAIVPAGGAGTRLWPLSRQGRPKFLLDLTGSGRTLLQQTWDRLLPLTGPEGLTFVTGTLHADAVAEQLPGLSPANLVAEPSPRDSAAAICLAAAVIERRTPGAVVGSFAADHVVRDEAAFRAAVREAVAAARAGEIVTLGITPDHPSTAFGYIRLGDAAGDRGRAVRLPCRTVRREAGPGDRDPLPRDGRLPLERRHVRRARGRAARGARAQPARPPLRRRQDRGGVGHAADRDDVLATVWPDLEKVAIDYAIAEPAADAGRVAVVPASIGWDDVGDWASLAALLPGEAAVKVVGDAAKVLDVDASGIAVPAGDRLVAVLGLKDVVVIDTPSAVLVTTREWAQDVKKVVEALGDAGHGNLR